MPANDECVTDERLRSIITVTAIYVAFKENWSPYFKYDDKDASKVSISPQKDDISTPLDTPPGSPLQRALEKRGSIRSVSSGIMRRGSILSRANRNSTISVDSITSADAPVAAKTGRSRADSNSTVLVHRATSNRRRNNQQATWRPDLLNAQNAVPEASREDLSRTKSARRSTSNAVASPNTRRSSARKVSVADETEESEEEDVSPTRDTKDDKLESSARSDTTTSEQPQRASAPSTSTKYPSKSERHGGRWKKLFCIR